MSSTTDFIAATLADALLPLFRRPVEDVVIETLDQRQVPTRTDFKELRDLVNSLRGQLTGATAGVKKLADRVEELEDRLDELDERMQRLETTVAGLAAARTAPAPAPEPATEPAPKRAGRSSPAKARATKTGATKTGATKTGATKTGGAKGGGAKKA